MFTSCTFADSLLKLLLFFLDPESLRRDVSQRQGTVNDARVMWVLDCDDQECSMVVGTKAGDRWRFENTAGGAVSTTSQNGHLPTRSSRILMMEMEDTE